MAETLRIEIPIEAQDKTKSGVNSAKRSIESLNKAGESAGKTFDNASKRVSRFDKQSDKTFRNLRKWAAEKYQVLIEARDKLSPIVSKLGGDLRSIGGRAWGVTLRAADFATRPIQGVINLLRNPLLQAGAVLGVSFGIGDSINTFKDFESQMSQVAAISGATGSDLDKLTEKAKEMGATTKFTSKEAGEAMSYMAMAGWKTNDMLSGISGVMNLAAASGEDLASVSDIVTDALTAFGMSAKDSTHFSDVLAQASSNANTTVAGMGETFKYAGSMAGSLGYSIEDVALATGLMANSGIKGTMAGTALNSIFTRLSTNSGKARDQLTALGISFFDANGNARDLSDVMGELRTATANMNDQQKSSVANVIAGTEAQKGLLAILNASETDYNKLAEAINNADGASARMAGTMMDNLQGSLTLLQSALDGVKVQFGGRLAPYVKEFADWATSHMGDISDGLDDLMDDVDLAYEKVKRRISDMTSSDEWANADLAGKIKIAWDDIIANPFKEWWNTTGRRKMADVAGDIGEFLGSSISTGLLMLFGVDVSDTVNEGAMVGKSFSEGFAAGFDFDAVKSAFGEGLKNIISDSGFDSLGSIASLAITARLAMGLGRAIHGGVTIGRDLFNVGGAVLGSASAGTGILGRGALTAIDLGAGNLAGGASLSAGALSALGLGAVAGGVVGGASAISGGIDLYKASKSKDADYKKAYQESGASKFAGVAGGAVAGAIIGSAVPVIGTAVGALIGAGVGGIAGWVHGNKVKKEYEENVEAAKRVQKIYAQTGVDVDRLTFKTEELAAASKDASVSASQFEDMYNEAVVKNLEDHFGNLSLSLEEIKSVSESIVYGSSKGMFDNFTKSADTAKTSLATVQDALDDIGKQNWKMGLTGGFTGASDIDKYKSSLDSYISSVRTYLENAHYEGANAMSLLLGGSADQSGLNSAYASLTGQVNDLYSQLTNEIASNTITLPDGTLQLNQTEEMTSLVQQISDIVNQVSGAQEEAGFEAIKVKYSMSDLDPESFAEMQQELGEAAQNAMDSYDQALTVSITNLKLQLDSGAIDEDTYKEQLEAVAQGYRDSASGVYNDLVTTQLEALSQAYNDELDGILPALTGTTAEKLQSALSVALQQKPDIQGWTVDDVSGWLGLTNAEDAGAIANEFKGVAASIPTQMRSEIAGHSSEITDGVNDILQQAGSQNYTISPDVMINPNYTLTAGATAKLSSMTASALRSASTEQWRGVPYAMPSTYRASGGIVNGRQIAEIGENGPELIVPLSEDRSQRASDLIANALGNSDNKTYTTDTANAASAYTAQNGGVNSQPVQVTVSVAPTFSINSEEGNENAVMAIIRRNMKQLADELGGEIGTKLEDVFSNMPLEGAM